MPSTTNFGWTTPADTDLVKDGASAIRTLGNGIDTSFLDLKGGTTGQVLSKNSNTDLDFVWVAQDDSNAIQNAIVDAKGDLITATSADTPARLAVGTNGQYLSADSTAATGLKWVSPSDANDLVLIGTTTFSSVSSQTLTGLSSTYDNFLMVGRVAASGAMTLRGRFSVSGSAATGASYSYATYGKTSGGSDVSLNATAQTYFEFATIGSDSQYINAMIFSPNQTTYRKGVTWQHVGLNSGFSPVYFDGGAWLDISGTAYNEIVLIASTGTISGTVSIYGYKK